MDLFNYLCGEGKMQMDKKQTSLLALTVLAFGFLGYQVYQLIGSDLSQTMPAAPATTLVSSSPTPAPAAPAVSLGGGSGAHVATASAPPATANTVPVLASKLPSLVRPPLLKSQQQYLELLNQYELLKMRRQMLEEQAAIAQAQNRIAVLNDQTRKLDVSVNTDASGNYTQAPQNNAARYQLSYIDQQNGQWTASIYHDGVYQVVNNGSLLADGSTVMAISQQGVTIQKQNARWLISFNGLVSLPPSAPTAVPGQMPTKMVQAAPKALTPAVVVKAPAPKPQAIQYDWQARTIFSLDPEDNSASPALDEHKVLSIPKGHYTIQLMGSYNKDIVDNFVKANDLKGKAFLYAVPSRDKYWYILILGDYSDLAHAKTALSNLPNEVKARGSWIRQYGEIQNMMRG